MICAICGQMIDVEDGYYDVDGKHVCLDCAYGMCGARLLEALGCDGAEAWLA